MGFRCSWIATRRDSDAVIAGASLSRSSVSNEPICDPGLYGIALPSGWYVVIGDGRDYMGLLTREPAVALSRTEQTLFFWTDDTPMCTQLISFVGGDLAWAITYNGSDGFAEPEIDGEPPPFTFELLSTLRKFQEGDEDSDHLYELTACVGERLVGFRHDHTLFDGEVLPIDVLTARTSS